MKKFLQTFSPLILSLSLSACASSTESDFTKIEGYKVENSEIVEEERFSGDFTVQGYSVIETIHESFCEDLDCPKYRYVSLIVTSTGHELPMTRIGLGCLENNIIRYSNDSDEFGLREKKLNEPLTTSIISSSKSAPISLHLVKLPVTRTRIAPTCSSEFTTIEGV